MPIYEYRCAACKRKTDVFVRTMTEPESLQCRHCGGKELTRAVSKFAVGKTTQQVWEGSEEPALHNSDEYYKDPRNIGRWTEKRMAELGVDMPEEAREMIDAARDGEMPAPLDDL